MLIIYTQHIYIYICISTPHMCRTDARALSAAAGRLRARSPQAGRADESIDGAASRRGHLPNRDSIIAKSLLGWLAETVSLNHSAET